ncbi:MULTISPECIES: DUF3040 domain-containing protein [Nocardiopsis]|uniref:DUF3040 domain-containing protein n=1 Tax=Nocardiopsis lambiniae TaxID=3075539 RepID=A0ABU2M3Q1_9ACTN|nr:MULTISPECIES: DUF3040 domain-containing protein [unclassified Nocardiopsis]MDE3720245.1 DUF3040 domain-containing protein [Nocardiopsis sp. N85]MDT0327257.1 DUF3040 domain-containing protein [Nocardiopsis sp. DSM 44743]
MPLSEHEQRMLDQIEQALYAEDPKFANTVRQTNPVVHHKRRIIKAGLGFVLGLVLMLTGLLLGSSIGTAVGVTVSVCGFLVMLTCLLWGLNAWRRAAGGGPETVVAEQPRRRKGDGRPGMMNRFEERWRRRQQGDE